MARCGCTTTCACSVVAGDGIEVTGNGSAGNPYEISTDSGHEVVDSPTVDLTQSGSGTSADPTSIQADVILSGNPNNLLSVVGDGLLALESLTSIQDNGDGTVTYTDENGNATVLDICDIIAAGGCDGTAGAGVGVHGIDDADAPIDCPNATDITFESAAPDCVPVTLDAGCPTPTLTVGLTLAPDDPCDLNLLECTPTGLRARPRTEAMCANYDFNDPVVATGGAHQADMSVLTGLNAPLVVGNNDNTDRFQVNPDGSVEILCAGNYTLRGRFGIGGSAARITGTLARFFVNGPPGGQVPGSDFDDLTKNISLANASEGPEMETVVTQDLAAGDVVNFRGTAWSDAFGVGSNVQGNIQVCITYEGETV